MKKNRWFLRAAALLALSAVLMTTLTVAATVGSSKDPLITLSYLEEVFMDEVLERVDEKNDERNDELAGKLGGGSGEGDTFTVSEVARTPRPSMVIIYKWLAASAPPLFSVAAEDSSIRPGAEGATHTAVPTRSMTSQPMSPTSV